MFTGPSPAGLKFWATEDCEAKPLIGDRACRPMNRVNLCVFHANINIGRRPSLGGAMSGGGNQAGPQAALGITAKSVGHSQGRARRFRWQRHAAKLLGGKGRVGLCRWSVVSKARGVDVVETRYASTGETRAHFEGVQTCGSVWSCPCCGARISETRRGELNRLLVWARARGLAVSMVTLTARHGREDDLADLLDRMKDAKRRWAQHRTYRATKADVVGSVTATEVTAGGANGWHPHFHMLLLTRPGVDLAALGPAWLASLAAAGLDGAGAAFQVQDASAAGHYVAKWGAGEEMTMTSRKAGRKGGGRTPAQLLAASCDQGDEMAGHLWREFSDVFRGRRQLVWSRGLKALVGLGEISDEDAAQDQRQEDQQEVARGNISHPCWSEKVANGPHDRRGAILNRAEAIGAAQAVAEIEAGQAVSVPDDDAEVIESGVHVMAEGRAPDFQPIGKSDHEARTQCAGIFAGSRHVQHTHAHRVQAECFRSADRTEAALEDGLTAGLSGEGPWPFPAP